MTPPTALDPARTLELAGAVLGAPLADPEDLGGSERSVVLRARVVGGADDGSRTVVVKRFRLRADRAPDEYRRERLGLAHLDRTPDLLASDDDHALLVMTDLGTGATLADLLLATDAEAARTGARQWAAALGDLAGSSASVAAALRDDLGVSGDGDEGADAVRSGLRDLCRWVGEPDDGPAVARTADEVEGLLALLGTSDSVVLWPGDTCPDNAVRPAADPQGWAFLDLEGTNVAHPALVAAYPVLPFATCWCVLDPPPGFTDDLRAAFTRALGSHLPDVVTEPAWSHAVDAGCAAWILSMTTWLLPRALTGDGPIGPAGRPAPTRRQHLTSRWDWAATHLQGTLPGLAALAGRATAVAQERWGHDAGPAGPYPAFSRPGEDPRVGAALV